MMMSALRYKYEVGRPSMLPMLVERHPREQVHRRLAKERSLMKSHLRHSLSPCGACQTPRILMSGD